MPQNPPTYFLTTPIYYVNARPHIGHAYTTIVADVLARRHRLQGDDTWFLTGTDEHGQKIERSAAAAGIAPQQFADQVSAEFRQLWDRMGLTYDQYIRTTDEAHKRGVQTLFATLQANGAIYKDTYTGQYCVSDEAFVDVPVGAPCPDCGRITETISETNYYFRLSAYQGELIDRIESNTLQIEPDARRNEVLSFLTGNPAQASENHGAIAQSAKGTPYVSGALKDLSISRTSFKWGIPVPGDEAHVIYVWLDALANYMTALGYGSDDTTRFDKFWPADLHIVGKEIIRFHCVYWPAFLLAAKLPLPRKVVAHGWLLFEESKMSKSKGNIVRAETILDAFGTLCPPPTANAAPDGSSSGLQPAETGPEPEGASAPGSPTKHQQDLFAADVLRYFLLREIPFGQDGSFSFDALITRYNADLANGYGNLVSRTLSMITQYFAGVLPPLRSPNMVGERLIPGPDQDNEAFFFHPRSLEENGKAFLRQIALAFSRDTSPVTITDLQSIIVSVDSVLSATKPWKRNLQDTEDRAIVADVLHFATESIRLFSAAIYPILPYATASVWRQLGLGDIEAAARNGELKNLQWGGLKPGTKLGPLAPIFPRADKGLAQIMADMESQKNTPPVTADPAAAPRTTTLAELNPGAQVAASAAVTTEREALVPPTEASAPTGPADASPQITIDDFVKVELRVAKVLVCERIPKADKLLRLEVDLGYEKRQILSGIAEWYTPEDLIGRRIVVITNLAPRKMRGLESHGMLLAASAPEGGKPALATFLDSDELPLGARLK
jgi:methionyl-tRNA synthetase